MKSLLSNYSDSITQHWKKFDETVKKVVSGYEKSGSGKNVELEGFRGASASFFVANVIEFIRNRAIGALQYNATGRYSQSQQKPGVPSDASSLDFVIVASHERGLREIRTDLETALEDNVEIYNFPEWTSASYRAIAKGSAIFGKRAGVLSEMISSARKVSVSVKPRIFLMSQRSLLAPVPDPNFLKEKIFSVHKMQCVDPTVLAEKLSALGYSKVPKVCVPGEFTLRGEVLDVFTPGEEFPTRIVFDFDTIESMKSFKVESQATIAAKDSLLVYPMKEVIWDEELVEKLDAEFSKPVSPDDFTLDFSDAAKSKMKSIISDLRERGEVEGEELFYPVLWERKFSPIEYISENATVFFFDFDRLLNTQGGFDKEYAGMYRKTRLEFPVFAPSRMLLKFADVLDAAKERNRCIFFRSYHSVEENVHSENDADEYSAGDFSDSDENTIEENESDGQVVERVSIDCSAPQSFFGNFKFIREHFESILKEGWKIEIFAENENQSLRMNEIFKAYAENWKNQFFIFPKAISAGFGIPDTKVLVIQENEIFGRRKQTFKTNNHVKSEAIDTFVELNPGDYVVHANYGIGQFKGIQRKKALQTERDYIKIEYADEEFLYVPLEQLNFVQRYIGNGGNAPKLDKLGGNSWDSKKKRAQLAAEEMAGKLVDLYSKRKISRGFAFGKYPDLEAEFDAAFPYEDTPDQYNVTKEIKADMEKPVPMDRLLCGDVGYGKTEIAMRAAFKAILSKKQVAFLAPTTLLAEQHYETCIERFSNFPVIIKQMSRFVSKKEQKQILSDLAEGKIDILIGTHRIIQNDVKFADLGLMIIDEEQRFGVKDKERLKTMRANIDCLSMSATPIPRTLHMSLLKIRDMSLLTTPPQTRKPIETFVDEYSEEKVARAIRLEIERGGQVFYLHNRVETLRETCMNLERLCPEVMIDYAHGQMSADELDDIFRRFKLGGFHVLVATTIIENGIDIPNVNTIIIDRADMYGISQLYQLRGRVGRSDKKAFAYLLYPGNKVLSEDAMKRLQAISDFTELGSGFKIAMKDMEIRGAGNLLGRDQSGEVCSVGFDLYMQLLTKAINKLVKDGYKEDKDILIELEYTGFLPETYIRNIQTKMEIYKKIASVQTMSALESLYSEMEDRFGPIPDEVYSLLGLAEIRIIAKRLSIDSLKEKNGVITVKFQNASDIPVDKFMRMWQSNPEQVKLNPAKQNEFFLIAGKIGLKEKSEFIRDKLESLM
ncbi:MAG: transcription-repair coupling factor [Treponema sp.]|nr:transcription-repair coupling factor [Treponema sp.]